MRATEDRRGRIVTIARVQRGFAMGFVFVLVALLLLVAVLVITGAFNATSQAQAVAVKYGVLNSAEAAANLALNRLAENPAAAAGCVTGSLNGAAFRSCLGLNNLNDPKAAFATDYANGAKIYVPADSAYVYGEAAAQGVRKVYVEAIAQPSPPLVLPPGAINAAQNINYLALMNIKQDPLHPNDADLRANQDITIGGGQGVIQGLTYAAGTDALNGYDGSVHSLSPAVLFPNATQISQAAQNAKLIAQSGAIVDGAALSAGGTPTFAGNLFVDGDVTITSGTVTLTSGSDVYINGNLCISGTGTLVNGDGGQGLLVVKGMVASSGAGGYIVPAGDNTIVLALGSDPGAINACSGAATEAISFSPLAGTESVGTAYAANGSVGVRGAGTVQGALDAGKDVDLAGAAGSAVQYDAKQAQTTLATGTMTYTAYNQD